MTQKIINLVENTSATSNEKKRPANARTKRMPRSILLWKLRALPGWKIIPEMEML